MEKTRVLVTGGAGYIGSVLVRLLLRKGFKVRVLDSLLYGGESIMDLLERSDFEFVKGDVAVAEDVEGALKGIDFVVHLAAIVGDPACAQQPEETMRTNVEGAKLLYETANKMGVRRMVFASTCSNYGKMENPEGLVTEESPLAPVSLYAETKVEVEQFLLSMPNDNKCAPTCLRFATVYGLSPRARFDLTINEFTKELAMGRELEVFGEQFWRPYCNVVDLCRSVVSVLQADRKKIAFNVFNVGDTSENYRKKTIVEEILKQVPNGRVKYVRRDEDPRDYRVSFEKIKKILGFYVTTKVPEGIATIRKAVEDELIRNPDSDRFKNS